MLQITKSRRKKCNGRVLIEVAISFLCWKLFPNMIEFGSFGNIILTIVIQILFCIVLVLTVIGGLFAANNFTNRAVTAVTIVGIVIAICSTFISLSLADLFLSGVEFSFWGKVILSILLGITSPKKKENNKQCN